MCIIRVCVACVSVYAKRRKKDYLLMPKDKIDDKSRLELFVLFLLKWATRGFGGKKPLQKKIKNLISSLRGKVKRENKGSVLTSPQKGVTPT